MSRNVPVTTHPAYRNGGFALVLALAAILGALAFQYIGGIVPCDLCLEQRFAYYVGIPALFVALILVGAEQPRAAALLFFAIALAFLANAGLGVYHAGVEWKFWQGPSTCTPALGELKPLGRALIEKLETAHVVRCDEAAFRLFGISLAGWNVLTSLLIFMSTVQAAFAASARAR